MFIFSHVRKNIKIHKNLQSSDNTNLRFPNHSALSVPKILHDENNTLR